MNVVIVSGNLGRDPEVRYTQNGKAVAYFSVAATERRKVGDEWQDVTEWVSCVLFGKQAEWLAQHTKKGSTVTVRGRLSTSKYQDKEGRDRYKTEVICEEAVYQRQSRSTTGGQDGSPAAPPKGAAKAENPPGEWIEDDLPF